MGQSLLSEEHVRTPGVISVPPVTFEVRTLSETEKKEGQTFSIDSVYSKTENASDKYKKGKIYIKPYRNRMIIAENR